MQHQRKIGIAVERDRDGTTRCLGMREASLCVDSQTLTKQTVIAESPPPYMNDAALERMRHHALDQAPIGQNIVEFEADDAGDFTLMSMAALGADDAALLKAAHHGWAVLAWASALGSGDNRALGNIIWPDRARLDPFARMQITPVKGGSLRLLSWGEDRGQAVAAMRYSLDSAQNNGAPNTLELISAALSHDSFERGDIDTGFLPRAFPNGYDQASLGIDLGIGHSRHFAGLCAIFQSRIISAQTQAKTQAQTQAKTAQTRWAVSVNDDHFTVQLEPAPDHILTAIDEDSDKATVEIAVKTDWRPTDPIAYCWIDERLMIVRPEQTDSGFAVTYRGAALGVKLTQIDQR